MANFVLDPNIDADTVPIGEMDLCSVLLKTDARFPWVLLVPRVPNLTEFHDLSRGERALCMEEIAQVSEALEGVTGCDKINMAALGNIVSQLHVHIIASGNPFQRFAHLCDFFHAKCAFAARHVMKFGQIWQSRYQQDPWEAGIGFQQNRA